MLLLYPNVPEEREQEASAEDIQQCEWHIQVFEARQYIEEYRFVHLGYHLGIIIEIILNILTTHANCSNLVIMFSY